MSVRARRGRRAGERGFTLVELLVGMILTALVANGVYGVFFASAESSRSHEAQAAAQADGRFAIGLIGRDVRQAVAPPGLAGATPVQALDALTLVVHVDPRRSSDPGLSVQPQRVRYALAADTLTREVAEPVIGSGGSVTGYGAWSSPEVLATGVGNSSTVPLFTARTADGGPATAVADVAQVAVRLVLSHRVGQAVVTDELRLDVTLRNV